MLEAATRHRESSSLLFIFTLIHTVYGAQIQSDILGEQVRKDVYSDDGTPRYKHDLLGHKTILCFMPLAYSPGDTIQCSGFRDLYQEFTDKGYQIVIINQNDWEVNQAWKQENEFQFEIWSDESKQMGPQYGLSGNNLPFYSRRTFVLDTNASILHEIDSTEIDLIPDLILTFISEQSILVSRMVPFVDIKEMIQGTKCSSLNSISIEICGPGTRYDKIVKQCVIDRTTKTP